MAEGEQSHRISYRNRSDARSRRQRIIGGYAAIYACKSDRMGRLFLLVCRLMVGWLHVLMRTGKRARQAADDNIDREFGIRWWHRSSTGGATTAATTTASASASTASAASTATAATTTTTGTSSDGRPNAASSPHAKTRQRVQES